MSCSSRAKVLHHVRRKGDSYFRSGDLLRKDGNGCYFFVDRLGDTFRWKGENISTQEVEAVVSGWPGVAVASVVGVCVPGCEGQSRIGCRAIAASSKSTIKKLGTASTQKTARIRYPSLCTRDEATTAFRRTQTAKNPPAPRRSGNTTRTYTNILPSQHSQRLPTFRCQNTPNHTLWKHASLSSVTLS